MPNTMSFAVHVGPFVDTSVGVAFHPMAVSFAARKRTLLRLQGGVAYHRVTMRLTVHVRRFEDRAVGKTDHPIALRLAIH